MAVDCAGGFSTADDPDDAVAEACEGALAEADVALAFVSSAYGDAVERMGAGMRRRLRPGGFLGCTVQGAIGGRTEVESGPSLSVFTARLPGAEVEGFRAGGDDGLPAPRDGDTVLLLADPFSAPLFRVLEGLPLGVGVVGGIASGSSRPKSNRLYAGADTADGGCVGARIRGAPVRAVVSQGCRPIGRPFVVTRAEDNALLGLAGRPPVERLRDLFGSLSDQDKALAQRGLHIGCAIDEYRDHHGPGDFLIRNVLGLDSSSGALLVTDRFRVGQTVQFHVRDSASATDDLERRLARDKGATPPAGAVLFTCNGRGTHLYGEPHRDASIVQDTLGPLPLAGFFAGGEVGPVGGRNYLHGFTASLALFG